jgi:hypothetical protein
VKDKPQLFKRELMNSTEKPKRSIMRDMLRNKKLKPMPEPLNNKPLEKLLLPGLLRWKDVLLTTNLKLITTHHCF